MLYKNLHIIERVLSGSFNSFKRGSDTNDTNMAIAQSTNYWNTQATKMTNDSNKEIAENQAEWSLEQQDQMNAFNRQMWEDNNEYNSLSSQLQRAKEAHVNPNTALGNSATSSPVQQNTLPSYNAPVMQSPKAEAVKLDDYGPAYMNGTAQLLNTVSDLNKKAAETYKIKQEGKQIWTSNQWQERLIKANLGLTEKQTEQVGVKMQEMSANIQQMQTTAKEIQQRTALLSEQTRAQTIENLWKNEQLKEQVRSLCITNDINEQHVPYVTARIFTELNFTNAQIKEAYSRCSLNQKEMERIDATIKLLTSQNDEQVFTNIMNDKFGEKIKTYETYKKQQEALNEGKRGQSYDWENNETYRNAQILGTIFGTIKAGASLIPAK